MTTTTPGGDALLTVGQTAEECGVTVRALHHYDQIGLLRPGVRSWSGYRLYDADDRARLHHIVLLRRLGLSLTEVAEALDALGADGAALAEHLRRRREAVVAEIGELHRLVDVIDHEIRRYDAMTQDDDTQGAPAPGGTSTEQLREIFGEAWDEHEGYQAEAEQRWGQTPQWQQSTERHARMTPEDWQAVKAEGDALEADLARAMADGESPGGERAMDLAERHRRSIEVHYDCPHAFHVQLGQMYVADPRFTSHYDQRHPGLAQWLADAIRANAARHEA